MVCQCLSATRRLHVDGRRIRKHVSAGVWVAQCVPGLENYRYLNAVVFQLCLHSTLSLSCAFGTGPQLVVDTLCYFLFFFKHAGRYSLVFVTPETPVDMTSVSLGEGGRLA